MKTICIYHSVDLDGWMSAAIVKHWFITNNKKGTYTIGNILDNSVEGVLDYNLIKDKEAKSITFLGYNYGEPIPDLSNYDTVIMCDVGFPAKDMIELYETKNFIWIDHHISAMIDIKMISKKGDIPMKGLRDTNYAACELIWQYFFPDKSTPEMVRLLGLYDSFRHKDTFEEQKVLEFQYGARNYINSYEKAYEYLKNDIEFKGDYTRLIQSTGEIIYEYLCNDAKQIYKNRFTIYFGEYKFCAINKERFNPINFGIKYHNDKASDIYYYDGVACFHFDGNMWKFSLYNDNGKVDVSQIAKQYGGGGHKGAAGFIIENINDFLIKHK